MFRNHTEYLMTKAHYESDPRTKGKPFEDLGEFVQLTWLISARGEVPNLKETPRKG